MLGEVGIKLRLFLSESRLTQEDNFLYLEKAGSLNFQMKLKNYVCHDAG